MDGQSLPLLHCSVVGAILANEGCRNYLRRSSDNLRTKLRFTAENLTMILDPEEDDVLRAIFIDTDGIDINLRRIQCDRMDANPNWKNDVSCVPQTILEKIMIRLGYTTLVDVTASLMKEFTANQECAVIASLIWR